MNTPRKPAPSWATMEQTLRDWHDQSINDHEYIWMTPNFEDMADSVAKAVFCAGTQRDMIPDNSWMTRQDGVAA